MVVTGLGHRALGIRVYRVDKVHYGAAPFYRVPHSDISEKSGKMIGPASPSDCSKFSWTTSQKTRLRVKGLGLRFTTLQQELN